MRITHACINQFLFDAKQNLAGWGNNFILFTAYEMSSKCHIDINKSQIPLLKENNLHAISLYIYTWNLEDGPLLLFCCWPKVIKTFCLKSMYPNIYRFLKHKFQNIFRVWFLSLINMNPCPCNEFQSKKFSSIRITWHKSETMKLCIHHICNN